ncbi:MAG: SDR family oxidoreductase [Gammaproteobacteria bacterium]|nr:SDR family oxidoreductase [Gammaproteobacteria bacterium]
MNKLQSIIILGATSSIAEYTARHFINNGASIFCIGRSEQKLESLLDDLRVRASQTQIIDGAVADLTAIDNHKLIFQLALEKLGHIDSVLIAHGNLPNQKLCELDTEQLLQSVQTNALSSISLMNIVANYLEKRQHGVIGVISSVAGDRGRQSNYVYGASKGMLSIYSQGLRNRLHKSGVSVTVIKPGFVDTPMTSAFNNKGILWSDPQTVAKIIFKSMKNGKGDVYAPGYWRIIMLIIKHIPDFIFKRLSL